MNWAEKIRCIEAELGIENDRGKLANILGVRTGIISDIKKGNSKNPGSNITLLLINKLGINPKWLEDEEQPIFVNNGNRLKTQPININIYNNKLKKQPIETNKPTSKPIDKDTTNDNAVEPTNKESLVVVDGGVEQGVLIPVIGQGVSAGLGYDYEEGEIIRYVKIPAWIARQGGDLVAMPIYGDSMEPTIAHGDLALCSSGGFCGDGVYMVRDGERGLVFCKRLLWTPGGWTVVSDNPRYEPMKIEDKSIEVVARVVAAVKEIK